MTEPVAYAFTNTGVYYTNDGTNFVINTTANATLSALGKFVLISYDNVTIGNSTTYNFLNATAWTGTANGGAGGGGGTPGGTNTQVQFNDSSSFGGTAGFVFNKTTNTATFGNSTVFASINSTSFSATANNTLFVGSVTAVNVVSNAQLSANLANYLTLAGVAANVLVITSNNTLFVGSVTAANVVSNAQLQANLANYTNTAGLAAYVQNTDSRTLSGNLLFSGANINFTGAVVNVGGGGFSVANSTAFISINPQTISIQTVAINQQGFQANNSALNLGNSTIFWNANSTYFAGPSTFTMNVGNSTINATMNATTFALNGTPISQSPWTTKSANYTAINGDKIIANTQGGVFTVTLPATPSAGYEVSFADAANNWVTNNLTISRNGSTIVGSATDLVCDTQAFFKLLYSGSTWIIETTASPSPGVGSVLYSGAQTLTANQQSQARSNISITKKNYIINGGMQISQENGTTAGTTAAYFPVDQFYIGALANTTGTLSIAQVASLTPGGSPNRVRVTVTAADASAVPAGRNINLIHPLEGLRVADLRAGTATPKTITVQFGVKAPAGTYCLSLRNGATNRSYVAEYVIAAGEANTDVVKSATFVLDNTGTWPTDNTAAFWLTWPLSMGTTSQTTPNIWTAGNFLATSNQFNFMATNGNVFELFDVGLYEGSVAPPFMLNDYDDDLLDCLRYFVSIPTAALFGSGTLRTGGTAGYGQVNVPVPLRTLPTTSNTGPLQIICGDTIVNAGALSVGSVVGTMINLNTNIVVSAGSIGQAFLFYQSAGKNSFNARM